MVDWNLIVGAVLTIFGGSYGLLRIMNRMVEAGVQKATTESKILLTKAESDAQSDKSLQNQMSSLIDLIRTQMLQQAALEADKIKAQNDLTSSIRNMIDEFKATQRAATNNTEDILRAYGQSVTKIELGFRGISDEFLMVNGAFTRSALKFDTGMDNIRSMLQEARNDLQQLTRSVVREQESLDDVVELAADIRNRIVGWLGDKTTEPLIRAANDLTEPRLPDVIYRKSEEQFHEEDQLSVTAVDVVLYGSADVGTGNNDPTPDNAGIVPAP